MSVTLRGTIQGKDRMLRIVLYTLTVLLNAPAILSEDPIAIGPYPDEFYCDHFGEDHVMCRFYDINIACRPYKFHPRFFIRIIVGDIFSMARDSYAKELRGFSEGLKPRDYEIPNMNLLYWDDELAAFAERYAYQCPTERYPFNDVVRFRVAQLLVEVTDPRKHTDISELTIKHLFLDPEMEIHQFHILGKENGKIELLCNYNDNVPMSLITNPYFKYYGCAFADMRQLVDVPDYKYYKSVLVCNFGPLTEDSFKKVQPRGKVCSQCPNGTKCIRNSTTPSLCQDSDEPPDPDEDDETVEPPTTKRNSDERNVTKSGFDENATATDISAPDFVTNTDEAKQFFDSSCYINCPSGVTHVRCAFNDSSYDYEEVVLISGREVRESIMVWHNNIRNIVAAGIQGYPMAGNMREIQWNVNLEKSAALWASQCKPHKYACQDEFLTEGSDFPTRVTQLVAPFIWDVKAGLPPYTSAVQNWLLGVKYFNRELLHSYTAPSKKVNYSSYAQLIWADTYMLGCAVALCNHKIEDSNINETEGPVEYYDDLDRGESLVMTVCNYAPGGLVDGKPVYLVGGPCSLCARLHSNGYGGMYCSREYINLCSGASALQTAFCKWIWVVLGTVFMYPEKR